VIADDVTEFEIDVPETELEDLRTRLRKARWPERETVDDWPQGVPLGYLQELCRYWADGYDWRATEARLNALPQFRTAIDGLGIHFLHVRSPHPAALPLVLTHGWPGSIIEFLEVIRPLTDPTAYGGVADDAFLPKELQRPSRRWAEKRFRDIRYWNEPDRGGHFAAFEQPSLFVDEVRAFFRLVR
jgi:pimeloyl-ACP methyl ester carboxylesterase